MSKFKGPKVLFLDIETAPMISYTWGIWDQNVALNQIHTDWSILSWAAKWQGSDKVMYQDLSKAKDKHNDKSILSKMWKLLDKADIIVTQNGKKFDEKKLNARFIFHGFKPYSPVKHVDTLEIAKKKFAFTSNKLAYMSAFLTDDAKDEHKEFPGFELWTECLKNNQRAWRQMQKYNKQDVIILEKVYDKLVAWDNSVNFSAYHVDGTSTCKCGSTEFTKEGTYISVAGRYQRYKCKACGAWSRGAINTLDSATRRATKRGIAA